MTSSWQLAGVILKFEIKKGDHLMMHGEVCRVAKLQGGRVRLSLFFDTIMPECCHTQKVKKFMNKKNLTTQTNDSTKRLPIQDLPVALVELSDEALSQVRGGVWYDADRGNNNDLQLTLKSYIGSVALVDRASGY